VNGLIGAGRPTTSKLGRIFSLLVSLFGIFASATAVAWWFNSIMIGLFRQRSLCWARARTPECDAYLHIRWIIQHHRFSPARDAEVVSGIAKATEARRVIIVVTANE
jgi:hypothetical protein